MGLCLIGRHRIRSRRGRVDGPGLKAFIGADARSLYDSPLGFHMHDGL